MSKKTRNKRYYEKHKEKVIARVEDRRIRIQKQHKQEGLCLCCAEPAVTGKVLCERHRKRMSSRDKQRCERLGVLFNSVGLVLEEMEEILEDQGYHCFFCPISQGKYRLSKDHDHREPCPHNSHTVCPNCFRGFLCTGCNIRIGAVEKNPDWATEEETLYLDRRPVLDLRDKKFNLIPGTSRGREIYKRECTVKPESTISFHEILEAVRAGLGFSLPEEG